MIGWTVGLVMALLLGEAAHAQALPSAEDVISKYVQALGGEAALRKVTTRGARGTLESPTFGTFGRYEEIAAAPDRLLRIFRVENYGVTQRCFNGGSGWTEDPEYGVESIAGVRLNELRRDAEFYLPLNFARLFSRIVVTGKTNFEDHPAYQLTATRGDGVQETFWFAANTGLLLGLESTETARNGVRQKVRMTYEDYRAVDGVQVPHTLRMESPALIWIVRRGVAHNIPIDPSAFAKP